MRHGNYSMVVEAHDPYLSSTAHWSPKFVALLDRSATTVDVAEDDIAHAASSLPASHYVYDLPRLLVLGTQSCSELVDDWLRVPILVVVPLLIDTDFLGRERGADAARQDQSLARLSQELRICFEMDQIESGMDHPAESVISRALAQTSHGYILDWLRSASLNSADPSFASSILRCLGRLDSPGDTSWRATLVRDALGLDDVEIRDAAAQAADSWADQELIEVLTLHREAEPWLQSYVTEIVADLSKMHSVSSS